MGEQSASPGILERVFKLSDRDATLRGEVMGGLTTFMTMSYIIFVNAFILGDAGMPLGAVMVATCLSAALASVVMGVYANLPVALASGMGMNALVAYTICGENGMGFTWQAALGMVFIAGALFLVLSVFRIRELVIAAIPQSLKFAAASGIGLFIAFIGLKNGGLVTDHPETLVTFAGIASAPTLITVAGLVFTGALLALNVRGAVLFGLVATGLVALVAGEMSWQDRVPVDLSATFLELDIGAAFTLGAVPAILTLLFFDLFDTVGTLMGVSEEAGLLDEQGRIPNAGRALAADAVGSIGGSLMGTTTVTSYIESAAGVAAGARTGLSSVVVGVLFLLAVPLLPVVAPFATAACVTAPALIIVGFLMSSAMRKIEWGDYTEGLPAFFTVILMPLTYSIAAGLAAGLVSYTALKVITGRRRDVHALMYVLAACVVVGYVGIVVASILAAPAEAAAAPFEG